MSAPVELPRWMDLGLLPLVNLLFALLVAGIVVAGIGMDPVQVITLLVKGAFGSKSGISYTLYYATTFVFTGLAVAVATTMAHTTRAIARLTSGRRATSIQRGSSTG